jgi:hypothetical protein
MQNHLGWGNSSIEKNIWSTFLPCLPDQSNLVSQRNAGKGQGRREKWRSPASQFCPRPAQTFNIFFNLVFKELKPQATSPIPSSHQIQHTKKKQVVIKMSPVGGLGRCYTLLPQHTLPLGGSKKALAL